MKNILYFISKKSIYDYAILIDGNQPYTSGKPRLIIVSNNETVEFACSKDDIGKKRILDFVTAWSSSSFPYREVLVHELRMAPSVASKLDEIEELYLKD